MRRTGAAMSFAALTPPAACARELPVPYELVLTPPAQRAISNKLPESVATAVLNFLTTALLDNPHRVGKPLTGELSGIWAARRGTYRVLYRINDTLREVVILRVEHRRDTYRPQ